MAKPPDINPEDIFSDESSFYGTLPDKKQQIRGPNVDNPAGDESETTQLEKEAAEYDPKEYWATIHPHLLSTIQYRNQQREHAKQAEKEKMASLPIEMDIDTDTTQILPQDKPGKHESSAEFLQHLPASSTKADTIGPWIYIHTPHIERLNDDVAEFKRKGREALSAFENEEARLRYENDCKGGSAVTLARKVRPLQRELEEHIYTLARETNCITGKWMMFITADRVDRYWSAVAEATINGHLGIAAKVATDDGGAGNKTRLIAVYTRDYEDRQDVKRVLKKLVDLNLVKRGERPIYYKRDALTYLEIMSNNKFGLKATSCSSADVLVGKF